MFIASAIVSTLLALVLLMSAAGKLTKQAKVVENLSKVGVPDSWLPRLAAAEVAGAAGLVVGHWVPALGIAAGVGVVLYFVGAVITHIRAGDKEIVPPLVLGLVAVAAIALRAASV